MESPVAGCLAPNDEILLINLRSDGSANTSVGKYEFLRVQSVNGSTVLFTTVKTYWYGAGSFDDTNIGVGSGQQRVVIQRVPNYNDLTIDGTLTGNPFDGYRYGIIAFRVAGTLTGNGVISADYLGYRGGGGSYSGHPSGVDGESYGGTIGVNGGGLGGPYGNWKPHGGGGGYATVGLTNPRSGYAAAGGKSYGVPDLSKLFFGSGGGGGGTYWKDEATGNVTGLPGSDGGGIVYILADTINFSGQINARGQDGVTGYAGIAADGGSGAGGSVRIEGRNVILNTVNVLGGMVTAPGSVGRVAVYSANSFSASFTPGYLVNTNSTPTPASHLNSCCDCQFSLWYRVRWGEPCYPK